MGYYDVIGEIFEKNDFRVKNWLEVIFSDKNDGKMFCELQASIWYVTWPCLSSGIEIGHFDH